MSTYKFALKLKNIMETFFMTKRWILKCQWCLFKDIVWILNSSNALCIINNQVNYNVKSKIDHCSQLEKQLIISLINTCAQLPKLMLINKP